MSRCQFVNISAFNPMKRVLLTVFAFKRYRQGVDSNMTGYTDPVNDHTTPYPSAYPPDGYQQSPFSHASAGEATYQPPAY